MKYLINFESYLKEAMSFKNSKRNELLKKRDEIKNKISDLDSSINIDSDVVVADIETDIETDIVANTEVQELELQLETINIELKNL